MTVIRTADEHTFPPGRVSFLPMQIGDGFNYGGGIILTYGEQSFNLGGVDATHGYAKGDIALAHLLSAAPDLLAALKEMGDWVAGGLQASEQAWPDARCLQHTEEIAARARAAVDKAEGRS